MSRKWYPFVLIIMLGVALLVFKQFKIYNDQHNDISSNKTDRDKGFDRHTSWLEYSNHSKCRMQCRHISEAEVEGIMRRGEINYNKSDLQSRSLSGARCPRYALEGVTGDNQDVRIIFAQCNEKTVVVTVIDLDTEWQCHCPGDDDGSTNSPYKNKL